MLPERPKRTHTPDEILDGHSPGVHKLAERVRRLVHETIPEASERAYPHWHGIGFVHPSSGYFCAIFPYDETIKLGFEFGVLLPDPQGLLEGEGKQVRYITIRHERDIRPKEIQALLRAAISLPERRDVRMSMIQGLSQTNIKS